MASYNFGQQKAFSSSFVPRSKGKADLSGMLMGGQFFALEVKRRNEKPTKEQLEYLAAVRDGGGIAAVVRNFNDAKNVLFGDGIKAVLAEEEMNHEREI